MTDQENSTDASSSSEPPVIPLWPWCVAKIKNELNERRTKREKENPQERLNHRTTTATVVIAAAAVVTIFVGVLQYRTFQGQLDNMRGQLDVMRADQRPWIKAEVNPQSLRYANGDATISYAIKTTNVGHSVAFNIRIHAVGFGAAVDNTIFDIPSQREEAFCRGEISRQEHKTFDRNNMGIVLFPGESYPASSAGENTLQGSVTILKSEIENSSKAFQKSPNTCFSAFLVGCVEYRANSETEPHQTGFIYEIAQQEPPSTAPLCLPVGQPLTPPKLNFVPWYFGAGKIN